MVTALREQLPDQPELAQLRPSYSITLSSVSWSHRKSSVKRAELIMIETEVG